MIEETNKMIKKYVNRYEILDEIVKKIADMSDSIEESIGLIELVKLSLMDRYSLLENIFNEASKK